MLTSLISFLNGVQCWMEFHKGVLFSGLCYSYMNVNNRWLIGSICDYTSLICCGLTPAAAVAQMNSLSLYLIVE